MIPAGLLLIIWFFFFLELLILIVCSLKNPQNVFIQPLPLYASCLFSMLLNTDIVDTKKADRIGLLIFVADEFSGTLLHPYFFMQFNLFSVVKEWRQLRQQKSLWCLDVIPLNNADSFFTARYDHSRCRPLDLALHPSDIALHLWI